MMPFIFGWTVKRGKEVEKANPALTSAFLLLAVVVLLSSLRMKQLATITVIGRDKTGVIARVTNFLFEQGANIEALEEQVARGQFSMTLQASWKSGRFNLRSVQSGLEQLGRDLRMEIRLRLTHRGRQRFAILATKEPHCLEALLAACRSRSIKAEPALVLSNRNDLQKIPGHHGIPFVQVPWLERQEAEHKALSVLEEHQIDFLVLARFMKILSPNFVWRYKNKIINIHPSLLPSFPGPQAYRQAYERGVKIFGVTAHFVTMHLDEGPIIAQASFPVHSSMGMKEIIAAGQRLESKVLVKAVRLFLSKRLDVYWGVVREV
jgi:formyltetrahydrofolate deformylase